MYKNTNIIGVAVICRKIRGRYRWFLAKQKEGDDWAFPWTQARKVESSVRAAIRNVGERGGLNAKVLEEVGRGSGMKTVGNQKVPQKFFYYFMTAENIEEPIAFIDTGWFEYRQAMKKLTSPRDKRMLTKAKEMLEDFKREERIK